MTRAERRQNMKENILALLRKERLVNTFKRETRGMSLKEKMEAIERGHR